MSVSTDREGERKKGKEEIRVWEEGVRGKKGCKKGMK